MGRKKGKQARHQQPGGAGQKLDSDDALLDAAIAEKEANIRRLQQQARQNGRSGVQAQLAAAQLGMQTAAEPRLSVQALVERMNDVPTFAIVNVSSGAKKYVPMRFQDGEVAAPEVCPFFIDPNEATRAMSIAARAAPDMELVLGVIPLGHAFALVVGWAEAQGNTPFTIRGSEVLARDVRPHLEKQCKKAGMPSYWTCPVIMCDELQSNAVRPVFLTHEGFLEAWKATGSTAPPPTKLQIMDLRVLVNTMLGRFEGVDWQTVRFLGNKSGHCVVKKGLDDLEAAGGIGSGRGSGDKHKSGPTVPLWADPDDDLPSLEPDGETVQT